MLIVTLRFCLFRQHFCNPLWTAHTFCFLFGWLACGFLIFSSVFLYHACINHCWLFSSSPIPFISALFVTFINSKVGITPFSLKGLQKLSKRETPNRKGGSGRQSAWRPDMSVPWWGLWRAIARPAGNFLASQRRPAKTFIVHNMQKSCSQLDWRPDPLCKIRCYRNPDLNIIEHLWGRIKKQLAGKQSGTPSQMPQWKGWSNQCQGAAQLCKIRAKHYFV